MCDCVTKSYLNLYTSKQLLFCHLYLYFMAYILPLQLYRKIAVTCSYSHSDLLIQKFVLLSRESIKEVFRKYELEMRWSLTI